MNEQVKFYPLDEKYKSPIGAVRVNEPTNFRLEFTRPSNPSEVYLVLTKDGEQDVYYAMEHASTSPDFTMEYTVRVTVTSRGLYFYHFVIDTEDSRYRVGCDESMHALLGKGHDWQLTVYEEVYTPPTFLKGGLIYQIMPDRFCDGGARNRTKPYGVYRDDWYGTPEYRPDAAGKIRNEDFFGGNLRGITSKLGYLHGLGVTCIYLNPIFEAHSNHKYDTGNYRRIDPDFGTADDLRELIRKADKYGIKIILDGVFSHTGDDSIYFNKYGNYDSVGAYQSVHSPYFGWYSFRDFPDDYHAWWNIAILPEVQESNPAYTEYICGVDGILRYWTEMGIGGWRLDVADELPDAFLDRAVHAVKAVNPGALVLGEVWEDASNKVSYSARRRYLQGGQLDSVTNYPFKEDILNFVRTGESARLDNTVHVLQNNYPKAVLDNLMNLLDTHDTARVFSVLGECGDTSTRDARAVAKVQNRAEAFRLLRLAVVLQYTLPGVPCIYYGDEAGLEGFEDPFNRRCYPWGREDKNFLRLYKRLGAIRTQEKAILSDGEYRTILAEDGVYAFARRSDAGELIVLCNRTPDDYTWRGGEGYTDLLTGKPYLGTVPPCGAVILKKVSPAKSARKPAKKRPAPAPRRLYKEIYE